MPHHPPQLQPSHLTSHAPHAPPVGHPSPHQCQQYQPQPSLAEMAHLFALQMQNHQKLAEEQILQQKQLFQLFSAMVPAQQAPILNPQPSVYPQAPLLPVQYNLHLQNEQTNLSQQNRAPTTGNSVSMVNVGDYCSNTSDLVGNDAYNLHKAQSGEKMVNKTVMPQNRACVSTDSMVISTQPQVPLTDYTQGIKSVVEGENNATNTPSDQAAKNIPTFQSLPSHSSNKIAANPSVFYSKQVLEVEDDHSLPPKHLSTGPSADSVPCPITTPVAITAVNCFQEPGLSVAPANYQTTANITACTQPVTTPIPLLTPTHSPLVQPSHSTKSKSLGNSVESYVPCTDLNQNQCHPRLMFFGVSGMAFCILRPLYVSLLVVYGMTLAL
ncbi:hypothetical protein LguiB_020897 [Lonicera macranthoides]